MEENKSAEKVSGNDAIKKPRINVGWLIIFIPLWFFYFMLPGFLGAGKLNGPGYFKICMYLLPVLCAVFTCLAVYIRAYRKWRCNKLSKEYKPLDRMIFLLVAVGIPIVIQILVISILPHAQPGTKCSICGKEPYITLNSGTSYCEEHFNKMMNYSDDD